MIDADALAGAGDLARRERPLEGLRVLELGSLIAGPFATRIMAEFGAEVIKVERTGAGDPPRTWRYVDPRTETSLWWALQSRNKKLVTLNAGHPEGLEPAKRLAAQSGIPIENFKPGTLEKLGLGWDVLRELNPRLGARLGLRADGTIQGRARLRQHRRGDGRHPLRDQRCGRVGRTAGRRKILKR